MPYVPAGVIPAVLLPFHEDRSIDEASYRAHLRDVAAVEGVSAITINAHASEVASCSLDEQRRLLDISREELGALPIVHGVYADGSLEAARIASIASAGGAAALLAFPPYSAEFGQRGLRAIVSVRLVRAGESTPWHDGGGQRGGICVGGAICM